MLSSLDALSTTMHSSGGISEANRVATTSGSRSPVSKLTITTDTRGGAPLRFRPGFRNFLVRPFKSLIAQSLAPEPIEELLAH